ncbi:MAG TPA: hypothetical protein VNS09_13670 [Solirubrobacter sp.]|nr:hypothetical protein [Solirubrobacter sp.]
MSTEPTSHEPAGGDALFFLIAAALIAVVTVEGLLIAFGGWWFMVGVLGMIACAALIVVGALVRLMDHDTPFSRARSTPDPEPEPEPVAAPRAVPAPSARVVAH